MFSEIRLPAKLENLGKLLQSILSAAGEERFDSLRVNQIELCAEEALVNVMNYAYAERSGDVHVICRDDNDQFIIEIIDEGIPFDLTRMDEPDTTAALSERSVGGLGIFFMRKMMDDVRYRRENNRNILSLVLNRKTSGNGPRE